MPFPLFHAYSYHTTQKNRSNLMYSVLPDFLGLINLSLWDRMHKKDRLLRLLHQEETNDACRAMLHHLQVDDIVEGHIHRENGMLRALRTNIEEDMKKNFNVTGKFAEELAEFMIELSLDQILAERGNFIAVFQKEIQDLEVETTAEKLKKVLGKSKRRIMRYLKELKKINPYQIITIDGVLEIAKRRYGLNFKSFLEISRRIQLKSLAGALKNIRVVRKLMKDQLYINKFKELQAFHKKKLETKFDVLIQEVKNGNYT